jgi:hypothetical protein
MKPTTELPLAFMVMSRGAMPKEKFSPVKEVDEGLEVICTKVTVTDSSSTVWNRDLALTTIKWSLKPLRRPTFFPGTSSNGKTHGKTWERTAEEAADSVGADMLAAVGGEGWQEC